MTTGKGIRGKLGELLFQGKKTFKKLICVLEPKIGILSLIFVESKHLKGQLDPPVCNVTLLDHQVVKRLKEAGYFCLLKTGLPHSGETLDFSLSFYLHTF